MGVCRGETEDEMLEDILTVIVIACVLAALPFIFTAWGL
jgi:hypothetical protein